MPTFTGTAGADVIAPGQVSNGVIASGAPTPGDGADTIIGGGGSDTLAGGGGDDQIFEQASNTAFSTVSVDGGGGLDILNLSGPSVASTLAFAAAGGHFRYGIAAAGGGINADAVNVEQVNVAADHLTSASFTGQAGANSIILLQAGSQLIVEGANLPVTVLNNLAAASTLSINTGDGADMIDATRLLFGGHGQVINSGGGDDTILPNGSTVNAGDGNDTIVWLRDSGSDTIDGGAGDDTLSISTGGSADNISLSDNGAGHLIESWFGIVQDAVRVETVDIAAGDRSDVIRLGELSGTDVRHLNIDLSGSAGGPDGVPDTVVFTTGRVDIGALADGSGLDVALTGPNGAIVQANVTAMDATDGFSFLGTAGDDAYRFDRVVLNNATFDTGAGGDLIRGGLAHATVNAGDGADEVDVGTGSANQIDAGAGADHVFDAGASDQVNGGDGDDVLDIEGTGDTVQGGAGADQLFVGGFNDIVSAGDGNDTIQAFESGHNVSGDAGDDLIVLDAFRSFAFGGDGNDTLTTTDQFGQNSLSGGAGNDHMQLDVTFDQPGGSVGPVFDGGAGMDSLDVGMESIFRTDGGTTLVSLDDQILGGIPGLPVGELSINHSFVGPGGQAITHSERIDTTGVEDLSIGGGNGPDLFSVGNLTVSGIKLVRIDFGDGAPDGVVDQAAIAGTSGADHVTVSETNDGDLNIFGLPAQVLILDEDQSSFIGVAHDVVTLRTGDGDDVIDLSTQNRAHGLLVNGGAGNDTMIGGGGATTFQLDSRLTGNDVMVNFRGFALAGSDRVQILGTFTDQSLSDLISHHHIVQHGADVLITEGQATLTLTNTQLSSLTASDFSFNPFGI